MTREEYAYALIDADHVGIFDDSNSGYAAALAAADLVLGWSTYDEPYQREHASKYQPHDVDEVINALRAWKEKGCPVVSGETEVVRG